MHQCADGVWRSGQFVHGGTVSIRKLDENGQPTGDWRQVGTAPCVHFTVEDPVD